MKRRDFIKTVVGGSAAIAAAPTIFLNEAHHEPEQQEFRITIRAVNEKGSEKIEICHNFKNDPKAFVGEPGQVRQLMSEILTGR